MLTLESCTTNSKLDETSLEEELLPELNLNNYDEIGFGCGYDGKGTKLVEEFTEFIKNKDYKKIKSNLFSKSAGVLYLATVSCEYFAKEGVIKLNKIELEQINQNKNKTDSLYTCSGCTESEVFTIKQLMNDSNNYIKVESEWWLDDISGKNIIIE